MTILWRISGVNFVLFGAGKSVENIVFRLRPLKVKGHFEVTSHLWLICQWLNNSEHFDTCCNLLSASDQKIWPFNWRKVRKKSWHMMTSKSDPRGHPGLKLCVHFLVMGFYRFINFHQNRSGSGISLGDFTWNDPRDSFSSLTSSLFEIVHWFCHHRLSLVEADQLIYFVTRNGHMVNLTTGHSMSRIDLNRSSRISKDASWQHFGTYHMSLSHSNQKLGMTRKVYGPYVYVLDLMFMY